MHKYLGSCKFELRFNLDSIPKQGSRTKTANSNEIVFVLELFWKKIVLELFWKKCVCVCLLKIVFVLELFWKILVLELFWKKIGFRVVLEKNCFTCSWILRPSSPTPGV